MHTIISIFYVLITASYAHMSPPLVCSFKNGKKLYFSVPENRAETPFILSDNFENTSCKWAQRTTKVLFSCILENSSQAHEEFVVRYDKELSQYSGVYRVRSGNEVNDTVLQCQRAKEGGDSGFSVGNNQ